MEAQTETQVHSVKSLTDSSVSYTVVGSFGSFACSCPHYQFRLADKGGKCKHIRLLEDQLLTAAIDQIGEDIPF